ncbi:MAG: DUF368 domain-containing protein [Ruminococcus sp.]|nr:DUF368 domain-containing protein [Ruminococcus sp.]MDY3895356.1 DUF368 domain-containing protein [Candidatus Fimenecus sp.]
MNSNTELKQRKKGNADGILKAIYRFFQGMLIGLGAVLPGISGGVMCVVFGVYKPIMELLSNPFTAIKKYWQLLIPLILGGGTGFVAVSKLLGFLLEKYPEPSVCLFVGLICGMLPSLFREAGQKGRSKWSFVSMAVCFSLVLALLICIGAVHANITPNTLWYLFCGFCIALSVIAPGMSFSTLLMPLGLYTPLTVGIGNFDMRVIIPAGIGALITVILLAKAVTKLLDRHYSVVFHGIIGIVSAATIVIIPFKSFAAGLVSFSVNAACLAVGAVIALLLDKFNSKVDVPEK